MKRYFILALLAVAFMSVVGTAQTTNTFPASGNVGIGTTSPTATLQVVQGTNGSGTISTTAGLSSVSGTGTQFLFTFKVGDPITANGETEYVSGVATNTSLTTFLNWRTTNSGAAYTLAGGTQFAVLGNGNVGIGTLTPTFQLDLQGTALMRVGNGLYINSHSDSADSNQRYEMGYGIYWNDAVPGYTVVDNVNNQATFANVYGDFVWTTHTGTLGTLGTDNTISSGAWHTNYDRMTLTKTGELGLGTMSPNPSYLMDVEGFPVNSSGGFCIAGSCITSWPSGSVTSLTAGSGLSGGTITGSGTLSLNLANSNTWTGAQTFNAATVFPGGIWSSAGAVGVGTASPYAALEVSNAGSSSYGAIRAINTSGSNFAALDPNFGLMLNRGVAYINNLSVGGSLQFRTTNTTQFDTTAMTLLSSGNVGIGTTTPGADLTGVLTPPAGTPVLDVQGDIELAQTKGGQIIFQDGSVQSYAWNGVLNGGDYAEDMRAKGLKEKYEPGDVLALAEGDNADVQKSVEPYSTMVAGIYATKPGVVGLRDAVRRSADNVPMAMVGVVPTKVTAENGPIRKGDLLVTSSLPGYAMKGTDHSRMLGAVLGKAMGSLNSGTGVIEVLVTLQ